MEIYLDTAKVEEIREFAWLIDGVTTNPTLMAQAGKPFHETLKEICSIVRGPVSAEVVAQDAEGMVREAQELAKIAGNIVIKIPLTVEGLKAVKALKTLGIKTNVTLVFSAPQALLAAKCGADYVSPFVGRIDDHGGDGMSVVAEILQIFRNYEFKTSWRVSGIRGTWWRRPRWARPLPPCLMRCSNGFSPTPSRTRGLPGSWRTGRKSPVNSSRGGGGWDRGNGTGDRNGRVPGSGGKRKPPP